MRFARAANPDSAAEDSMSRRFASHGRLDKIGIRVPAHKGAQLLPSIWQTLVSSQRQPSGQISPSTADHVIHGLGEDVDLYLMAGHEDGTRVHDY